MQSPTAKPVRKVIAASAGSGVGGAIAIIVVWLIATFAHADIPDYVTAALTILFGAGAAFIAGYATPPHASETPVPSAMP
jgi:cobalamin synthase